jgi:hypothetical protein
MRSNQPSNQTLSATLKIRTPLLKNSRAPCDFATWREIYFLNEDNSRRGREDGRGKR